MSVAASVENEITEGEGESFSRCVRKYQGNMHETYHDFSSVATSRWCEPGDIGVREWNPALNDTNLNSA